jgi:hypothetical protein
LAGKMPGTTNEGKRKINDRNHQNTNGGRISNRQCNTSRGGRGGQGRGRGGRGGREKNNSEHLKNVECFNCGKKGHYSNDCSLPRKNDNEQSNMVSKSDFKNIVKLLPLPQPPVCARTNARTNPSAQRATQLRSVLARVYVVSIQNQITTTVP